MKGWTKKKAKLIIDTYKDRTAYYGKNNISLITDQNFITYDSMYEMFRGRMGMGKAETLCIIASLVLSGAKIDGELTLDY